MERTPPPTYPNPKSCSTGQPQKCVLSHQLKQCSLLLFRLRHRTTQQTSIYHQSHGENCRQISARWKNSVVEFYKTSLNSGERYAIKNRLNFADVELIFVYSLYSDSVLQISEHVDFDFVALSWISQVT